MAKRPAATPMLRQYLELKALHPEALLLFQLGDFYELFREDATTASGILDLLLTQRGTGKSESVPMCGVPVRSASEHIRRLVAAGYTVAIAEQVEEADQAKGLVRREITEVVTPGTLTEESHLPGSANWLAALYGDREGWGVALLEITLGQARLLQVPKRDGFGRVAQALRRAAPAELLLSGRLEEAAIAALAGPWRLAHPRPVPKSRLRPLERYLDQNAQRGLGLRGVALAKRALAQTLGYAEAMGKWSRGMCLRVGVERAGDRLVLDPETARNLALAGSGHTLLGVVDSTRTPMGRREMADRLARPLTDMEDINARLSAVEWFTGRPLVMTEAGNALKGLPDLARAAWRVEAGRAAPADLFTIREGLRRAARVADILAGLEGAAVSLAPDAALLGTLEAALPETLEGDLWLNPGWDEALGKWQAARQGGKTAFADYEAAERGRTGIATLKVRRHKQLGWVLQVPAAKAGQVPPEYERRQSLAASERFCTNRLRELEQESLVAESRFFAAREAAFARLIGEVSPRVAGVVALASALGALDATISLAQTALDNDWCRPALTTEPLLKCEGLRHPVVEAALPVGEYVPNPISLVAGRRLGLVTGPNMAGKSTVIRSAALCVILAQAGSFVPARKALVGIADAVYARIGSSDAIAEGQSTFLVEMADTAAILHQATRQSIVILDEIGRGTATYDGMAIAWAVAEHLAGVGCRTLFATHYHELCDMEADGVHNLRLEVAFAGRELVFLHALSEGRADRSYGVEVARMAGFPPLVLRRAREVLAGLGEREALPPSEEPPETGQQGLFGG